MLTYLQPATPGVAQRRCRLKKNKPGNQPQDGRPGTEIHNRKTGGGERPAVNRLQRKHRLRPRHLALRAQLSSLTMYGQVHSDFVLSSLQGTSPPPCASPSSRVILRSRPMPRPEAAPSARAAIPRGAGGNPAQLCPVPAGPLLRPQPRRILIHTRPRMLEPQRARQHPRAKSRL